MVVLTDEEDQDIEQASGGEDYSGPPNQAKVDTFIASYTSRGVILFAIAGGEHDGDRAELDTNDAQGVVAWLAKRTSHAGLSRLGGSSTRLQQTLAPAGITVEPVREAGLMKQAGW